MIQKIAEIIVFYLEQHNAVRPEDRDICVYGCDIALYTFLSTAGLLVIGAGFSRFFETVILIAIFYLNQTMGGGYHASTHIQCFLTMAIGVLVYIATFSLFISVWVYRLLGVGALVALFTVPLVLHKNKQYLLVREAKLKLRSRLVLATETAAFGLILLLDNNLLVHACASSLVLSAISRCVGAWLQKH